MYGLINEALRDLITSQAGLDTWLEICQSAALDPEGFEPLCPYADSVTYNLVGLASEKLAIPQDEILRRFGQHWVSFTAEQGYGDLMRLFGNDFKSCLANLNRMHAHMGAMMPHLTPPKFIVEGDLGGLMKVHYFSTRRGLGPMVVGLLEGLAKKFDQNITITYSPQGTASDHDEFVISFEQP